LRACFAGKRKQLHYKEEKNEMYSTANESSIVFKPSNISKEDQGDLTLTDSYCEIGQNRTNENYFDTNGLLIKKCLVSFMTSSISFYLQSTDFEEKIGEMEA
jgi:hypothetical protein